MLIAARGNPRLPALSDSPVMLVANVLREWGEGGGEGDTTLLNNWGASQIKKIQSCFDGMEGIHFNPYEVTKREGDTPL